MAELADLRCEPARHLFIAVPSYTGLVSSETKTAVETGGWMALRAGITVESHTLRGDCYIEKARNRLVTEFLESRATDLLFIDDDIGFRGDAILQIALVHRPFVAGVYPQRKTSPSDPDTFPVGFLQGEQSTDWEGLLEVEMVPTGFLRLNRAVFTYMPHLLFPNSGKTIKGYFETQLTDGEFVGEDVLFCRRWRALGGRIYCLPDIDFQHVGRYTIEGNLHKWLLENCG